ncbi:hypothetical protein [Roseimaritima ulvae]|uniref:Uncharacterized protein n=1 Tax=Roseimaritima ulvae TaxID=980254 RepID=A0A5B9QRW4_9BACT|nr:hypothetical protein [Roseimaritima ulvae]QEG40440.1 hypothetical protein UC8_24520 [Roseimaritima ulvae]
MLPHGNAIAPTATIARLYFLLVDEDNALVTGAVAADFTSIGRASVTDQVTSATINITPLSDGANPQASLSAGTVIEHGQGVYSVDAPGGPFAVDSLHAVAVHSTGTCHAYVHLRSSVPTAAETAMATRAELAAELANLDEAVSAPKTLVHTYDAAKTASQFNPTSDTVIVGTNNDKTGYGLTSGERSALAGVIDLAIINQGDGADLIGALADAIAADWIASDASPLAMVAALKADSTYTTLISDVAAGKSAAELLRDRLTAARSAKLDRDLAHAGDAATYQATVPTVQEIDTQLTSTHGAGAWTGGGGGSAGSGQFKQDLLITNQADVPIPRAIITVLSAEGTSLGIYTASGTEGEASLMLDAGEYILAVTAYPTHIAQTQTITITGDPTPLTIQLAASVPSPPEIAGLCRVRIPVREANIPAQAAQITAQPVGENQKVGNDLLSRAVTRAESDATGYAELLLPQGAIYRIVGMHAGYMFVDIQYAVPFLSEAYVAVAIN